MSEDAQFDRPSVAWHETVVMPFLGEYAPEATVSVWLKNVGDYVTEGEPLIHASTTFVDTEIPSTVTGVLDAQLAAEGEPVPVGSPLASVRVESVDKGVGPSLGDGTKVCPFCAETIQAAAILCRYCRSELASPESAKATNHVDPIDRGIHSTEVSSSMQLTPWPGMEELPSTFEMLLTNTQLRPVHGEIALLEVHGLIKNVDPESRPWSYHISIVGRRKAGNLPHHVGLMGQAATAILLPGQQAEWVAKIIVGSTQPEYLHHWVRNQAMPGEIPVNPIDSFERPELLGSMASLAMNQVRATLSEWEKPQPQERPQVASPEPTPDQPEGPTTHGAQPRTHRSWPHMQQSVPVSEWKGMRRMTRDPFIAAFCPECGNDWTLSSQVGNSLAQEQGLGGRLQRRGTAMEQFGASATPFASGRRIAAGNERARLNDTLSALYQAIACPHCGDIAHVRLALVR